MKRLRTMDVHGLGVVHEKRGERCERTIETIHDYTQWHKLSLSCLVFVLTSSLGWNLPGHAVPSMATASGLTHQKNSRRLERMYRRCFSRDMTLC
jgi:hypothetical protein